MPCFRTQNQGYTCFDMGDKPHRGVMWIEDRNLQNTK